MIPGSLGGWISRTSLQFGGWCLCFLYPLNKWFYRWANYILCRSYCQLASQFNESIVPSKAVFCHHVQALHQLRCILGSPSHLTCQKWTKEFSDPLSRLLELSCRRKLQTNWLSTFQYFLYPFLLKAPSIRIDLSRKTFYIAPRRNSFEQNLMSWSSWSNLDLRSTDLLIHLHLYGSKLSTASLCHQLLICVSLLSPYSVKFLSQRTSQGHKVCWYLWIRFPVQALHAPGT